MSSFLAHLRAELDQIEADGLYKRERPITSPQAGRIDVNFGGRREGVISDWYANNLGLIHIN